MASLADHVEEDFFEVALDPADLIDLDPVLHEGLIDAGDPPPFASGDRDPARLDPRTQPQPSDDASGLRFVVRLEDDERVLPAPAQQFVERSLKEESAAI